MATAETRSKRLLNLGCGSWFHPDWINVDLASTSPHVLAHDLRKTLPFPSQTFDAVYHSHVLEHLERPDARKLVEECARVLRPGGIARIVVPDLETIARLYLSTLERAIGGDATAEHDYEWMMLEMYDQTVRTTSGGMMQRYLAGESSKNLGFIRSRTEIAFLERPSPSPSTSNPRANRAAKRLARASKDPGRAVTLVRGGLARALVNVIGGKDMKKQLDEGIFRASGEIHRWMYDRYSLGGLLSRAGFSSIKVVGPSESQIPHFETYGLDVVDGRVRKPDSLFMEAQR